MYQLPSGDYSPPALRPRVSAVPRVGALIVIWILFAAGYAGYRLLAPAKHSAAEETTVPAKSATMPYAIAAWKAQTANVNTAALRTETEIQQAEAEIRRTLTLTDSIVVARHLHAALAKLQAARQRLEEARYDLDSFESTLKGEEKQ